MNEHFIRFIFNEDQGPDFLKTFAGAMASTVNESLNESEEGIVFESYTTEGMHVYEVALNKDLDDDTAEEMANTVAKAIPSDFEIEVSGGDDSSR
jgi:hypothetical protein